MIEEQKEILNQFRQQQEKYTYYIIALCVTSIGFSIYKTSGTALQWSQIPLGMAILSWAFSIYCGLKFLQFIISTLYANNAYFEILQGKHPVAGNRPDLIKAAASGVMEAMEKNSNTTQKLSKNQNRLFFLGMILFLFWHVLEMYLKV